MDKLTCIKTFVVVARLGSFTAAANELNTTQSAVSKKVAWLERSLAFTLLQRSSRQIQLTRAGQEYLDFCHSILEQIEQTERGLRNELSQVSGKLTISAPSAFATHWLAKPIQQFLALHPKLTIDVSVNDKMVDLYRDDIDVAIRASVLKDSTLKAKKLMTHSVCYFASPEYLAQYPPLVELEQLTQHKCLTYSLATPSDTWLIDGKKQQVTELVKSDSPQMLVELAKLGCGIAAMPKWMVHTELASGQLVELFRQAEKPILPMYAVYKNSEHLPFRIRAFIDYLTQRWQAED